MIFDLSVRFWLSIEIGPFSHSNDANGRGYCAGRNVAIYIHNFGL